MKLQGLHSSYAIKVVELSNDDVKVSCLIKGEIK